MALKYTIYLDYVPLSLGKNLSVRKVQHSTIFAKYRICLYYCHVTGYHGDGREVRVGWETFASEAAEDVCDADGL